MDKFLYSDICIFNVLDGLNELFPKNDNFDNVILKKRNNLKNNWNYFNQEHSKIKTFIDIQKSSGITFWADFNSYNFRKWKNIEEY